MTIAFKHALLVMLFLLVIPMACADPIVLPIINQDEFQACVLGWCQTVAPPFLFTDINLTFANYSYISVYSNETNYSLEANHSSYCDSALNSNYSSYANESEYLNGLPSSTFYNSSNPSGFISGFTEVDPLWSGNYSLVAFTNQQSQWNVNNSNTSNYCSNLFSTYCYNESYNPFITPKTCSDTFDASCNSTTLNDCFTGSASLNGTQSNGCNGTQVGTWAYITEVYINATNFFPDSGINVTCNFAQTIDPTPDYAYFEYVWYYNTTNWINIQNWTNYSQISNINRSAVFRLNSSEGTQIVRCIIDINNTGGSGSNGVPNECANGTYSTKYDNDDVNFTVTENDTGNITYEACTDFIQNITVNNSIYFNGFANSYFYPYSNPYNFINSSYNSTYNTWAYNQTTPAISYINGNPFNWINTSYNSTYDALVTDNASWNESLADSLYAPIGAGEDNTSWNESYANTLYYGIDNPFNYINYTIGNTTDEIFSVCNNNTFSLITEPRWQANYTAFNASWSADLWNTSAQVITAINTSQTFYNILANNSNYLGGKQGKYFWNTTGGITYNNLTLANSIVKGDLANAFSINLGNISTGAVASNWNMSIYNQSYYLSSASVPTCSKYYNGASLLWCDCYNSTHKWMANTC